MLVLSRGLSNAMICVLIILIVHVLISNMISPIKSKKPYQSKPETFQEILPSPQIANQAPLCSIKPINEGNMAAEKQQLMEFVFGTNEPYNEKGLDEFFKDFSKQISTCQRAYNEPDYKDMCKIKSDDHRIPLPSTCDPKLLEMGDAHLLQREPKPCNTTKETRVLNDFKDDNSMNNGQFGNLNVFDDTYLTFSVI